MIRFPHFNRCPLSPGGLFLGLLLLLPSACDRGPQTLPGQVLGDWKTDNPRYRDRFLKLEPEQVTFGVGGVATDQSEHVERVRMTPIDKPTNFVIGLRGQDGGSDSIILLFSSDNGGELRLKNQPTIVWRRKSTPTRIVPSATSRRATTVIDRKDRQHRTIYRIDCIREDLCRSY